MSNSSHIPIRSYRRRGRRPRPSFAGRARAMTPLGPVVRGLPAGPTGTAAMDALARYRRGHGEKGFELWESSSGLDSWERAPAPARVGKRPVEGPFAPELPPRRARLVNIAHWVADPVMLSNDLRAYLVYGLGTAAALRLVAGRTGAAS